MQLVNLVLGLGLTAVGLVQAQAPLDYADLTGTCGQTCITGVLSKAVSFGCASDLDTACLCAKPDFHNGVKDCAKTACSPELQTRVNEFIGNKACVGIPSPPPAVVAIETSPGTAPTATPAITIPSSIAAEPTTTPVAPVSSAATSAPTASNPASSPPAVSSSSSVSPTPVTTTESTSQSSPNAASTSAATTSSAAPSPTADAQPATGLSMESKIGLGVGAAAAFMGLIGLIACLLVSRRRKAANTKTHTSVMQKLKISDPMPGSGRTYANDHHNRQYEAGENDLEMRSKRYEEYEPRVSPRNMV